MSESQIETIVQVAANAVRQSLLNEEEMTDDSTQLSSVHDYVSEIDNEEVGQDGGQDYNRESDETVWISFVF